MFVTMCKTRSELTDVSGYEWSLTYAKRRLLYESRATPRVTVKPRIARGVAQLRKITNDNDSIRERIEWDSSSDPTAEPIASL